MIATKQIGLTPAQRADERDEYHRSLGVRRLSIATNATMGAAVSGVVQGASSRIAIILRGRHCA